MEDYPAFLEISASLAELIVWGQHETEGNSSAANLENYFYCSDTVEIAVFLLDLILENHVS